MNTRTILLLAAITFTAFSPQVFSKDMPACALDTSAATTNADANVASWEKSRALYLHDLRLANLEQKQENLSDKTLKIADTLSDAGLYLAYAETDNLVLNSPKKAQADLDEARGLLKQASALANHGEQVSIDKVSKSLDSTEKMITACNGKNSDEKQASFENLRKSLGQIVNGLG